MAQENLEPKRIPSPLSLWPPSHRTREAVVQRLIDTLTTPSSVLSKRFGVVLSSDAESAARSVEQESLAAVSEKEMGESVEEGIQALQVYSKEISERLLDFMKSRAGDENSIENEEQFVEEEGSV